MLQFVQRWVVTRAVSHHYLRLLEKRTSFRCHFIQVAMYKAFVVLRKVHSYEVWDEGNSRIIRLLGVIGGGRRKQGFAALIDKDCLRIPTPREPITFRCLLGPGADIPFATGLSRPILKNQGVFGFLKIT